MDSVLIFPISKLSKNRLFRNTLISLSIALGSVVMVSVTGSIVSIAMSLIAILMGLTTIYRGWVIRNSTIHMEIDHHGLVIRWARTHKILWDEIIGIDDISPEITCVKYKRSNRNNTKESWIFWRRISEAKEDVLAQVETSFGQSLRVNNTTAHTTPTT